eukprot:836579-Rhodomonas_salina.3
MPGTGMLWTTCAISLCKSYAIPGTDLSHAPTRALVGLADIRLEKGQVQIPMSLQACYAIPGTKHGACTIGLLHPYARPVLT